MDTASAQDVVRDYLAAQREELEASLPALDEPEAVHRLRTRARRIRSVQRAYAAVTPTPGRLVRDLRWLGVEVGRVRDLDVLGERLGAHAHAPRLLAAERAEALAGLRTTLDGTRARCLRGDLGRFVASGAWADLTPVPMSDVAHRVLAAERSRVLDRDRLAAEAGADRPARLHDVRKAAKRLRYAAEAAGSADLAACAEALQELLGAGNDAVMAADWLDRAARSHPSAAASLAAESARQRAEAHADGTAYARAIEALRSTGP